jgi:hypothetical protein
MAEPRSPDPALLVVAAFSRHLDALAWARDRLQQDFGPIALASPPFDFNQTTYYEAQMGQGLQKQILGFGRLVAPACLAGVKLRTNQLERELAGAGVYAEMRPVNLDPGLLTLGKFLLATGKDQAHRVYLSDGIFAEVTLRFHGGAWEPWPWTYADYRQPVVLTFLGELRDLYRGLLAEGKRTAEG